MEHANFTCMQKLKFIPRCTLQEPHDMNFGHSFSLDSWFLDACVSLFSSSKLTLRPKSDNTTLYMRDLLPWFLYYSEGQFRLRTMTEVRVKVPLIWIHTVGALVQHFHLITHPFMLCSPLMFLIQGEGRRGGGKGRYIPFPMHNLRLLTSSMDEPSLRICRHHIIELCGRHRFSDHPQRLIYSRQSSLPKQFFWASR